MDNMYCLHCLHNVILESEEIWEIQLTMDTNIWKGEGCTESI
jgi:hypothetical protein